MKKKVTFATFFLVMALLVLTLLGHRYGLYDSQWWYDNMTHTIGGVFLSFFGFSLLFRYKNVVDPSLSVVAVALFVFAIGVFWEVYEYAVQLAFPFERVASPLDSLQDVALDILGGMIGICFVHWLKKRYTTTDGK